MSITVTIRLTSELANWLKATARARGVPVSRIVREQLERARASKPAKAYMELAGCVGGGPRDLSIRRGFSRK